MTDKKGLRYPEWGVWIQGFRLLVIEGTSAVQLMSHQLLTKADSCIPDNEYNGKINYEKENTICTTNCIR